MNKKIALSLLSTFITASMSTVAFAGENDIIILHTNDSHCGIENGLGFAGVSAYKLNMEEIHGDNVVLVDAGDAIQGGPIGKLTTGSAIIDIMNEVGYDYFAIGNHEFDYQIPRMIELMDMLEAVPLSSNFINLTTGEAPYQGYSIAEYGDKKVAFVGITTPESLTKSTPTYFQDGNGNFIYTFMEDATGEALYANVQDSIDSAIAEGADYVVGIGHLGIEDGSAPWRSTDIIENTTGFDIFIDGHSHSEVCGEIVLDKSGNGVVLSQAGERLEALGKITIDPDTDEISAELIFADDYTEKDPAVQNVIDSVTSEFEALLTEVVAHTDVALAVTNPVTGERMIRNQETNLGNLVADAYRSLMEADIAMVNGGGIRSDINVGDITNNDIIEVHPFSNSGTTVKVTGQTILDALEMGSMNAPEESGGFLHVSGMTYTIDTSVPSSIVTDEQGSFVSVAGDYRVKDVMIAGEAINLDQYYTVASHDYMLLSFGDGMAMFKDAEVIKDATIVDNEILINYITENLGGVVGAEYGNIYGDGRINIATSINPSNNTEEVVEEAVTEPVVTEPVITEPVVTEPVVTEPVITEPVITEPVVTPEPVVVPEPVVTPEPVVVPEPAVTAPAVSTSSKTYTVVAGDNLWKIAKKELGSGTRYTDIYESNKDIIKNENLIHIGQVLTIPNA